MALATEQLRAFRGFVPSRARTDGDTDPANRQDASRPRAGPGLQDNLDCVRRIIIVERFVGVSSASEIGTNPPMRVHRRHFRDLIGAYT